MIFAFGDTDTPFVSASFDWAFVVYLLIVALVICAYFFGRRSGRSEVNPPAAENRWSRVEVLTVLGVMVMVVGVLVTLLNPELRRWLGL